MFSYTDSKSKKLEDKIEKALYQETDADFAPAAYDESAGERTGYSNYSYWGSTFRAFLKNRTAVFFLIVLVVLVVFTVIQPYLPNQYPANTINNNPATGMQLSNMQPSFTTKYTTIEAGTEVFVKDYDEQWYSISNIIGEIRRRTDFTVLEYGEEYCKIEFEDGEGYVITKEIKIPDEIPEGAFETKANFNVDVYSSQQDISHNGDPVYARKDAVDVTVDEDGLATLNADCTVHILPTTKPFLFGTNNIGQDLWACVWTGTRTSLFIGLMVALCEAVIGITMGVLWGYVRKLDRLMTEVYNVVDNIPNTILLILISYIMRPGISTLIFAMCLTGWLGMARFIRNQIVIIRDRDYNLASRCLGTGTMRIIFRNLLPYLVSVIMLRMALAIPGAIGNEVFITYIGLGLPVDTPSLGNLINTGRKLMQTPALSYQLFAPAIVLSIITISFYIIGNAFADAADPKNHR